MLMGMRRRFSMTCPAVHVALLVVGSGVAASLPAAEFLPEPKDNARRESFDGTVPGKLPAGWTAGITGEGVPRWSVVAEGAAPSAPHVLQQSGEVPKASFPLCLFDGASLRDGFVEVKFKAVRGKIDQAAGVVWRAQSTTNYYICRANALEDNVVLYKVENGKRQTLSIVGREGGYGVDARVTAGEWHALRVEFRGPRFRVTFDGKALFEVEDATFTAPGKVGLWTKADSVTLFDDFRCGPQP